MSNLSDGLHRDSDREVMPSWQACCRCNRHAEIGFKMVKLTTAFSECEYL